jgi:hypothetical protein
MAVLDRLVMIVLRARKAGGASRRVPHAGCLGAHRVAVLVPVPLRAQLWAGPAAAFGEGGTVSHLTFRGEQVQ